ncbi:MAG: hypothetical protein DCC58_05535 [Chloroflexi bacterium]|nr:MAG: hypothetical protein DCC58_05535 [Chloroflexota bacterium]
MSTEVENARTVEEIAAIDELRSLILLRFPEATFHVEHGIDDPEAIHLVTTIDSDDAVDLLEYVLDRQMQMQIEEGIPIFIIPTGLSRASSKDQATLAARSEALLSEPTS